MSKSAATVGTLIIRVATLWFGVAVGLAAFAVLARRMAREGKPLDTEAIDEREDPRALVSGLPTDGA
jgi:hypothetical protein